MTLRQLREYGITLLAEERALLLKLAMGEVTDEDAARYTEVSSMIDEIEARLHRAGGDGARLTPTPIG